MRHPETWACWLRAKVAGIEPVRWRGVDLDGHAQLRLAYVLTHDDPAYFGDLGPVEAKVITAWDALMPALLASERVWFVGLGAEITERLRGVAFGPLSGLPALNDLESAFVSRRVEDLIDLRTGLFDLDIYFVDHLSNAGPELDEAVERLRRSVYLADQSVDPQDRAFAFVALYAAAVEAVAVADASRSAVASMVAGGAAAVTLIGLSVGVSVATGGAAGPFAMAMITAASAAASMSARMVIEGPRYTTSDELTQSVQEAIIEGATDFALLGAGSALKYGGKALLARLGHSGILGQGGAAATDLVQGAGKAVAGAPTAGASTARTTALSVLRGTVEGVVSGAVGEIGMTALDASTWDQSTARARAKFWLAAKRGALFGAVFGLGGGVLGGLGGQLFSWAKSKLGGSVPDAIAVVRFATSSGLADQLEGFADIHVLARQIQAGDLAGARRYLADQGLNADQQARGLAAVQRYVDLVSEPIPGLEGWDVGSALELVKFRVIDDAAFKDPSGNARNHAARVRRLDVDSDIPGLSPVEIVLRESDGAERLYEELIHARRLLAATASDLPQFDDVRTVLAAQKNWGTLSAKEKVEANIAAANEEVVARGESIAYLEKIEERGSLTPDQAQALAHGREGEDEAAWLVEQLEDLSPGSVTDEYLGAWGLDVAPEFFGRRRGSRFSEEQLAFYELAAKHKVGSRRKLSPSPRKHGEFWDPETRVLKFNPEDVRPERAALAEEFPQGVAYDKTLRPVFEEVVGPDGEPFAAMYRTSRLGPASAAAAAAFGSKGYIEVTMQAGPDPSLFTSNRERNMRNANAAIRALHAEWKQPKGYTWHEELVGCTATMVLVWSDLHGNVPHTGGVALAKTGKCGANI